MENKTNSNTSQNLDFYEVTNCELTSIKPHTYFEKCSIKTDEKKVHRWPIDKVHMTYSKNVNLKNHLFGANNV